MGTEPSTCASDDPALRRVGVRRQCCVRLCDEPGEPARRHISRHARDAAGVDGRARTYGEERPPVDARCGQLLEDTAALVRALEHAERHRTPLAVVCGVAGLALMVQHSDLDRVRHDDDILTT